MRRQIQKLTTLYRHLESAMFSFGSAINELTGIEQATRNYRPRNPPGCRYVFEDKTRCGKLPAGPRFHWKCREHRNRG